jgi:hypothetical protein
MTCIKLWYYEVNVEAYKNGTSFKVAMEEHGMEIAEFLAVELPSIKKIPPCRLDSAKVEDFLNGIASYMNGQTFEEAFGDTFDRENFEKHRYYSEVTGGLENDGRVFNDIKHVFSYRLDDWVCRPPIEEAKPYKEDASRSDEMKAIVEKISEHVLERLKVRNVKPNSHYSANKYARESIETKRNLGNSAVEEPAESVIFKALDGKVNDAKEVTKQLRNMIFSLGESDLQMRAEDREAARNIAEYIAENYLNPEEAQAFMNQINKYIESSEMRDIGGRKESLFVPESKLPDDLQFNRWRERPGNKEAYESISQKHDPDTGAPTEMLKKLLAEYDKETMAYLESSKYSEENFARYAKFEAKEKLAQGIFDKAKKITDFSGNEKWNLVMNLLKKAA